MTVVVCASPRRASAPRRWCRSQRARKYANRAGFCPCFCQRRACFEIGSSLSRKQRVERQRSSRGR